MTSDLGCFGFYCIYLANLRRSAVGRNRKYERPSLKQPYDHCEAGPVLAGLTSLLVLYVWHGTYGRSVFPIR